MDKEKEQISFKEETEDTFPPFPRGNNLGGGVPFPDSPGVELVKFSWERTKSAVEKAKNVFHQIIDKGRSSKQ